MENLVEDFVRPLDTSLSVDAFSLISPSEARQRRKIARAAVTDCVAGTSLPAAAA